MGNKGPHRLPDDQRSRLQAMIDADGNLEVTRKRLGISRHTMERAAGGLTIQRGTMVLLEKALAALVLVLALIFPAASRAEPAPRARSGKLAMANSLDRETAREDAQQAEVAFNLGHYIEAASLYEQAYRLVPDPILLYDIGQCLRLVHEPDKAIAAYRSYLRTSPADDPLRAKVAQMIDDLGWDVEVQAKHDREASQVPQAKQDLTVPLPIPKETHSSSWKRWAPWVGTGLTAALAVAAIAEGVSANTAYINLRDTCGKTKSCTDAQISSGKSKVTTTNVLWGLTAASATVTGVSFYLDLSGNKEAGISLTWRH